MSHNHNCPNRHCGENEDHNHHHHNHHHHYENTSTNKILIAFVLNLVFSIFEIIGGIFTGSIAIVSDAIHDFGDAASIGISYYLEKKSKRRPDKSYTFGYGRYSVLGALITSLILIFGSTIVVTNAIHRFINPTTINYNGMIMFAIIGVVVNFIASAVTSGGNSLNQKAVNLHMLEDVLGWIVVLVGAILIRMTGFVFIDAILSIGVALFILHHAVASTFETISIFLEKTPSNISIDTIQKDMLSIENIENIHDLHIWSIDGINHYATIHIVTDEPTKQMKEDVRKAFEKYGIIHSTIQVEKCGESCLEQKMHKHIENGIAH